jgi:hypothetical protein
MRRLVDAFQKAVLDTSVFKPVNVALAAYGLSISGVGMENFELRKSEAGPRFYANLWLSIFKSPNAAAQ